MDNKPHESIVSHIAQIAVVASDEEVALADSQKLRQFSQDSGFILFLQSGNTKTVSRFYPPAENDFLTYTLPSKGLQFQFHPTDFTQVNTGLNRLMDRFPPASPVKSIALFEKR
jgi:23S rRNA (uracil1939-C5)-methyltransferase